MRGVYNPTSAGGALPDAANITANSLLPFRAVNPPMPVDLQMSFSRTRKVNSLLWLTSATGSEAGGDNQLLNLMAAFDNPISPSNCSLHADEELHRREGLIRMIQNKGTAICQCLMNDGINLYPHELPFALSSL
jgi:hypothetical protein